MDASTTVELLKGWASLIGAISWPLVIVFVLLYFGRPARTAHSARHLRLP